MITDELGDPMELVSIAEASKHVENYHDIAGDKLGVPCGLPNTEDIYRIVKGQMCIVTGIPGAGKSEILDQMAVRTIYSHGWNWCYYSPENMPIERHAAKIIEKAAEVPFGPFHKNRMTKKEASDLCASIGEHVHFIQATCDQEADLEWTLAKFEEAHKRCGLDAMVLDPWQELSFYREPHLAEHEYIKRTLTLLRRWARDREIALFIVAHPKNLNKGDDGNYPVPTPYDISGGAVWRNSADACLSVYRQYFTGGEANKTGEVSLYVQKIRERMSGELGKAQMFWSGKTGSYYKDALAMFNAEDNLDRREVMEAF
jgi:twinkle protein